MTAPLTGRTTVILRPRRGLPGASCERCRGTLCGERETVAEYVVIPQDMAIDEIPLRVFLGPECERIVARQIRAGNRRQAVSGRT